MSRIVLAIGLASAVMALGACASQGSNPVAANQKASQQKPVAQQKQHMVCVTQPAIGSHIATTNCMTEAQYKEMQKQKEQQREQFQRMQQSPIQSCQDTGCPPLRR